MRRGRSGPFCADGAVFVILLLRDGSGGVERDLVDELAGVEPGDEDDPARHAVAPSGLDAGADRAAPRSEEHTSELQSLMRISYAVFCLNKHNYISDTHN